MEAYKLLICTCMALAMAANATSMNRGIGVYNGNWTQPDLGNTSTEAFGTRVATSDDNYLLKLINETAHGQQDEQTAKNADMEKYAKVFETQPPLKGTAMRKLLKLISELEKLQETIATIDKVDEKDYGRPKRANKDWHFAPDSSFDQNDVPAEFEPTSAKIYRAFGKFEAHKPSLLGHRRRNQYARLKKFRRPTEKYVANLEQDNGAYANEHEGKFQPKMNMPRVVKDALPPFAMAHDSGRSNAGSQTVASNMGQMMHEQREGNDNVRQYVHSQDTVDDFMNIDTYDTPSAQKRNENKDTFGLCDGSANDAALSNTYAPGRILHKNRLAPKVPRRKLALLHRIAPGGVLMIIHGKGKVPAPEQIMQRMLPIALKLRNERLKAMEKHNEALQPEKAISDVWPISPLLKFGNALLNKFGLVEAQPGTPQALPDTELHVHNPTDATCHLLHSAAKENSFNTVAKGGQDYGKYNKHDVDPVNDERMGAARIEANAMPDANCFLVPQVQDDVELDDAEQI